MVPSDPVDIGAIDGHGPMCVCQFCAGSLAMHPVNNDMPLSICLPFDIEIMGSETDVAP